LSLLIVMNYLLIREKYYFTVANKNKIILLWNGFFNDKNWGLGNDTVDGKFLEKIGCRETRCVITSNKTFLKEDEFDALVYHAPQGWDDFPKNRSPDQVYVLASLESPVHSPLFLTKEQNIFNWTSKCKNSNFYRKNLFWCKVNFLEKIVEDY
jgi:hypothetical protein